MNTTKVMKSVNCDPKEYSRGEFAKGMKVEVEHANVVGKDPKKIGKIVKVHLQEDPKYYTKVAKVIHEGPQKENKEVAKYRKKRGIVEG